MNIQSGAGSLRGQATPESLEEQRLQVLNDLHILDTKAEDRFDRITALCTLLFDVPIAAITLIDRHRQWFKSKQGLGLDSTRREDAFCNVTITRPDLFVVEHASTDPYFEKNPYVVGDPNIEFYAGYPIEAHGQRLGALCIMDDHSHQLSAAQEETLRDLALWVQTELQRDEERERATEIHRALMPVPLEPIEGYQVGGFCIPSRAVGGDFMNWTLSDGGELVVTLADVMGKGMAAAVLMASVRAAVKVTPRNASLAESISNVSYALERDLDRTGSFVTLFKARIDIATGMIEYVDAGLGLATMSHRDGSFTRLNTRGLPIGIDANTVWPLGHSIMKSGDTLIVVSDGLWYLMGGDAAARDEIIRKVNSDDDLNAGLQSLLSDARDRDVGNDVTVVAVRRD